MNDQKILHAAMRQDLGTFMAKVFPTVSPGDVYLHNWHIDAVHHALMQIHQGKTRRLIVTQPPRSLKSICTSVAFVAWSIGHDPSSGLPASPTRTSLPHRSRANSAPW